ncbi:hypothetical protein X777_09164 [Ooceraea biroi]|uniref:Uncharacterized protein n=1 Tax=Ooceraea biroi TaxID=2015173 RepID=A0A026W6X8_OOCBI|nr:hypothetical protein X777_09164 [Ooceraea biroi]
MWCPAHCGRTTRAWLDRHYPRRWIGRGGVVSWPPRSPDLTPVDFFVWGALKQEVYSLPVTSREQLRDRIVAAVHQISPISVWLQHELSVLDAMLASQQEANILNNSYIYIKQVTT